MHRTLRIWQHAACRAVGGSYGVICNSAAPNEWAHGTQINRQTWRPQELVCISFCVTDVADVTTFEDHFAVAGWTASRMLGWHAEVDTWYETIAVRTGHGV
jgi:hypothetical protein